MNLLSWLPFFKSKRSEFWNVGGTSSSGVSANPATSDSLSAYYAAKRNISEDIAKMDFPVFKKDGGGGKVHHVKHPAYDLLMYKPNKFMSAFTFKETMTAWMLGWGNAFAVIDFKFGKPVSMLPIHPARVSMELSPDGDLVYLVYESYSLTDMTPVRTGEPTMYMAYEIFHLHGLGDGFAGVSVLQHAKNSLGMSLAAQEYMSAFFANGAHASGVLEGPTAMSDEAYKRLLESWNDRHQGAKKAHRVAILEEGFKFNTTSINPKDAQLIELCRFNIEEIARWFRIQPHKIGDLSRSTNNNIEQQSLDYVGDTLLSHICRWESETKIKLLGEDGVSAKFQTKDLLRGDTATRTAFYNSMFNNGAMSPNQILMAEDMNPMGPEGDAHYIPMNLMMIGDTKNEKATVSEDNFSAMVESTSKRIVKKEEKAVAHELKKDRDHAEYFESFFADQIDHVFGLLSPIADTMARCTGSDVSGLYSRIEAHYSNRSTPSTVEDLKAVYAPN